MRVEPLNLPEIDYDSKKEIAILMMKFWKYQCDQKKLDLHVANNEIKRMVEDNERELERRKDDDEYFGGFSNPLPHPDQSIEFARKQIPRLESDEYRMRMMYEFFLEEIVKNYE